MKKLNFSTVKIVFQYPELSNVLVLSVLYFDFLLSGCWQIAIHPGDRKKTAFLTKAPVIQNPMSKSHTRSYENLVDVVIIGNFGQFWLGCALYGVRLLAAVPLLRHCLSTA